MIEWLGGGGMGAVYRARHTGLKRDVALKLLHAQRVHDAEAVQRFLREARAAASIQSPHVVEVSDFGVSSDGRPFLVMELVAGQDLERRLTRGGAMGRDEAVGIVLDVLAALEAAHAAGVVHRDLKAGNVLLGADGVVRLVDFGLAKLAKGVDALTRTGTVMGTPVAMSPEQVRGSKDVDARTDLWAVGVLLYRALSGRLPFQGTGYEDVLVRICTESPAPLAEIAPHVPPGLAAVVERALQRDPAARFSSAAEMSTALRQAMRAAEMALADTAPAEAGAPPPPATDDEEDEEVRERERADRRGPGLRPSLAFAEVKPRGTLRLPLALGGFVLAAGALIVLALVLRPGRVAPETPAGGATTAPAAPLPPHELVRGVVLSVAPDPRRGPEPSVAPPTPMGVADAAIEVVVMGAEGPLAPDEVRERLRSATWALQSFREPFPVQLEATVVIQPNGVMVTESTQPGFHELARVSRFRPTDAPTTVRLRLVLPPKSVGANHQSFGDDPPMQ